MKTALIGLLVIAAMLALTLLVWRMLDHRFDRRIAASLLDQRGNDTGGVYSPDLLADQPEPVRRYFDQAIAPGTPLRGVVDLRLEGRFNMGTGEAPHHRAMYARQVLAYPSGFVWQVVLRSDETWLSGTDGAFEGKSWSRFWLMGLLPVARVGGTKDHYRSSFGRFAAEAVFWAPASVLPGPDAQWRVLADDMLQVTLRHDGQQVDVDIVIDGHGAPVKVAFDRWSDANPEKTFRLQRFGGYLSDPQTFDGMTIPTRVIAGNNFEADGYFPFYDAKVTEARYLPK